MTQMLRMARIYKYKKFLFVTFVPFVKFVVNFKDFRVNKFIFFLLGFLLISSASLAQDSMETLISPGKLAAPHAKFEGITNCTKCHKLRGGVPDSNCLDCHDKLAARIKNKQGVHARYTDPCISCHSDHKGRGYKMTSLDEKKFDHKLTDYPLVDKHAEASCAKCHKKSGVYTGLKQDCLSCHKDYHNGQLDKDCSRCHNIKGWKDIKKFNHNTNSKYILTEKHIEVKCEKCHTKGRYKPLNYKTCNSADCHTDPHKKQLAGKTCESCHTTKGWQTTSFDHNAPAYKGYKLEDKHLKVECEKCHTKGRYKPLNYKTCNTADCHNDPHKKQFEGKTCESCHTTKGWQTTSFDHNAPAYKGYKLEGKHIEVKCEKCHTKGRYKPLKYKTCDSADCHTDPHKKQFADKTCESCHVTKDWKSLLFEHNASEYKGYKLDGKHLKTDCEKCHTEGKYKPIEQECLTCHKKDDTHKEELGKTCRKCHTTEDWKKTTLNHNLQTKFPLIGKHKDTECEKCHKEKRYKTTAERCVDCHKDVHKGEFKEECSSCHTQFDWEARKFDHKKRTGFELKGLHNDVPCAYCHKTKDNYKKVNRYCNQCHTDPHLNQFGSIECSKCHNQNSWQPVGFRHNDTGFPLSGRHRDAECQECHKNQQYRGTSSVCVKCHLSNYYSAPNHLLRAYSQDCTQCHNMSSASWAFKHLNTTSNCSNCHLTAKPLSHTTNNWTTCEDCHKSTTAWTFTHSTLKSGCSSCHANTSTPVKPANHTTNNWTTCETCHKSTITWSFTHPTTTFPLNHRGTSPGDCAACHPAGAYKNSGGCTTCHGNEHKKNYANSQCLNCHPTGKED